MGRPDSLLFDAASLECRLMKKGGGPRLEQTTHAPSKCRSHGQISEPKDRGQRSNNTEGERNTESKVRCNRHAAQFEESLEDGAPCEFLSSPEDMLESDAGCRTLP